MLKTSTMSQDTPERKVLRRKRQVMCVDFQVTKQWLNNMVKHSILSAQGRTVVMAENSNAAKVTKLLDTMNGDLASFKAFCQLLDEEYEWLAEELRAELKADKGALVIEPYIQRESEILVQKDFGHSKRLTPAEKKEMEDIIALKTQCTKEVWNKRLKRMEATLEKEKTKNKARNARIAELLESVGEFMQSNENRIPGLEIPRGSPNLEEEEQQEANGDADGEDAEEDDVNNRVPNEGRRLADKLNSNVEEMLKLTAAALEYRDKLREDRGRALDVLGCSDPHASLDLVLKETLDRLRRELEAALEEARLRQEETRRLEQQVMALRLAVESELAGKDEKLELLKVHMGKSNDHISGIQSEIDKLQTKLRGLKTELSKYRTKAEMLEKHRRIGYKAGKDKQPLIDVKMSTPKLPTLVMGPKGVQMAPLSYHRQNGKQQVATMSNL